VQNHRSAQLVQDKISSKILVTGDIRVDRVVNIANNVNPLPEIDQFLNGKPCIVFGSSWETEEAFLIQLIQEERFTDYKFILVPHEIDEIRIQELSAKLKSSCRYTQKIIPESKVLILDTVGLLAKIFQYAYVSVIGGGFSTGIHSILEPAAFGSPVIFGPKYAKFIEASDLIELGGAKSVNQYNEFIEGLNFFSDKKTNADLRNNILNYIQNHCGATEKILKTISPYLQKLS
jgi:3-deoxy-D-manno-octulosonic-acid transferase